MTAPARENRKPLVPPRGSELHTRDMTATFGAELTLAEAQVQLAAHDQWLPIDGDPTKPLGELVSNNSTGPLRLGYGEWRDLLLGVQFTLQSGELITAGGRTVKNVAGYDITKLLVGSFGRLGEIVTLTTRTYRRPAGAVHATFEPDVKLAADLLITPLRPQWMLLDEHALTCGYLGDEAALNYYRRELATIGPRGLSEYSLADDIAHRQRFRGRWRVSVPPSQVMAFGKTVPHWIADPAFGIVLCDGEGIAEHAMGVGGAVVSPIADPIDHNDKLLRRLLKAFT